MDRRLASIRTVALAAAVTLVAVSGCVKQTKSPGVSTTPLSKKPDRVDKGSSKSPTPPRSASANTDPSAMRLHDICGALLAYYISYNDLPTTLDDLKKVPGQENIELTSPVGDKPYVYKVDAMVRPERGDRILCYDPSVSTQKGFRWAISLADTPPDQPVVMKVIALPESAFRFLDKK